MAKARPKLPLSLVLVILVFAAYAIQESRSQAALPYKEKITEYISQTQRDLLIQGSTNGRVVMKNSPRRLMIGSTAPTCTYNECRGCRYKCRAEQVPVEGNDPINSAYHYRCVCHR
ncbi:Stomagen [Parasponia andersonii]|uniref:Stomagen n=1 Tax=Parasponia andersonii TaxID=3476 RepID=A0A2P5DP85_PARAD|nr:Stomagen [Parasponia andersonii]